MPLITIESGELPAEVKEELTKKITDLAADVTGIPKSSFWVFIKELPDENISVGGKSLVEIRKELNK